MKQIIITLFIGFITTFTVFGQQAYMPQRGQRGYVPPMRFSNQANVVPKDIPEELSLIMPLCIERFGLDAFEQEIMKSLLTRKMETENAILANKDLSIEDRKKAYLQADKTFFAEVSSILTEDEIEELRNLNFGDVKRDEKKKRRKKKRKKS